MSKKSKRQKAANRLMRAMDLLHGWRREVRRLRQMMKARETPYEEVQAKVDGYTSRCLSHAQRCHLPIELRGGQLRVFRQFQPHRHQPGCEVSQPVFRSEPDMSLEEITEFMESVQLD
ncbi:MAG TPA: hypothetical protein VJA21_01305 [Verrucomicrobiae bacterium]